MQTEKNTFPGLNGLRTIAAFSVLIQHTGDFMVLFGIKQVSKIHYLCLSGRESVNLFFVLSGFLITHILLQELEKSNEIRLSQFYKRRGKRILPLYFLAVALSLIFYKFFPNIIHPALQPHSPLLAFSLIIFFLPNLALLIDNPIIGASHLWSLGVENQFYLFWPLLLLKFKNTIFQMIVAVFITKCLITWLILPLFINYVKHSSSLDVLSNYLKSFSLESLSFGALGAWLLCNKKNKILDCMFHPMTQTLAYGLIFWVMSYNLTGLPRAFTGIVLPIGFLIIILNVSCNPKSFLKLRNPVIDYLGKLSYGVYIFHLMVVYVTLSAYTKLCSKPFESTLEIHGIYLFVLVLTTILAGLSYHYFEILFLKRGSPKEGNGGNTAKDSFLTSNWMAKD